MAFDYRLATLFYDLDLRTARYDAAMQQAGGRATQFASVLRAHPVAAAGAFSAALALIATEALKASVNLDTMLRRVTAQLPQAAAAVALFRREFLDLTVKLPVSLEQLGKGMQTIIGGGGSEMQSPAAALRRLELSARGAAAAGMDVAQVAGHLDNVLDAFGQSGDRAAEALLHMAFNAARGRVPVGELLGVVEQLGPVAMQAGMGLEQLIALVAAMMDEGKSGAQVTRGLRTALSGVDDDATKAGERLRDMGVQLTQVNGQWKVEGVRGYSDALADAAGNANALGTALANVQSGPGEAWRSFMAELAGISIRAGDAIGGVGMALLNTWRLQNGLAPVGTGARPSPGRRRTLAERIADGYDPTPEERAAAAPPRAPARQRTAQELADAKAAADELTRQVDEAFGRIRERFNEAWAAVLDGVEDRLEGIHAGTDAVGRSVKMGTEEWQRQFDALGALREHVEGLKAAAGDNVELQDQLTEKVRQIDRIQARMTQAAEKEFNAKLATSKLENGRADALQAQARNLEAAARGALQLAEAFGLVDERAARALESVVQIAANVPALLAVLRTEGAGAGAILGAALPVIGGLSALAGAFGSSPEEQARRAVLERNTEAIEVLTLQLGEFGLNLTGSQFGGVQQAASRVSSSEAGRARYTSGSFIQAQTENLAGMLRAELQALGLTMGDLRTVAQELGISFAGATPNARELEQLVNALAQADLARFAETFTDQLAAIRAEFDLFDLDDPIEQLRRMREMAGRFSPALAGIGGDLSTAEGRAAAEAQIQALFRALQTGTLTNAQLGGLTPEQFLQMLLDLEAAIDAANAASGTSSAGSGSSAWTVDRRITIAQGDRMLASLQTSNYWLERIAESLGFGAAGGGGGVEIHVAVGAGVGTQEAERVGRAVGEAAAAALTDRAMAASLRERRRALGDGALVR